MKVSPGRITANIPHPDTSELLCISLQYRPADTTEIFSSESVKIGTLLFANVWNSKFTVFFHNLCSRDNIRPGREGEVQRGPDRKILALMQSVVSATGETRITL